MKNSVVERTRKLKEAAFQHGFMGAGISRAEFMEAEAGNLEDWLAKGFHGEMGYMANNFDIRVDPTRLVPGAKSVISLMYNYFPESLNIQKLRPAAAELENPHQEENGHTEDSHLNQRMPDTGYRMPDAMMQELNEPTFKISRYAYGEDYHKVVRKKLKALVQDLKQEIGDFHGRVFVDSAPVMERDWAKRSGQGWVGKNTLLIHPKKGSYFFLAEIILDVEFEYDHPMRDHCGTCTRCIDACPTDAISPEGYVLDGTKCISYLTIELKSNIPESFKGQMEDWIFGCDICQEVCPWNRFATPHDEPAFKPNETVQQLGHQNWIEMTDEIFIDLFGKTPLKRAGLEKLKETIAFNNL